MKTTYVPTTMKEIRWDTREGDTLHYEKESCKSFDERSGKMYVDVDLNKRIISYKVTTYNDDEEEVTAEDAFDYITEKGGLRWLYKALDEIALMKHLEFSISYILRDVMVYLDSLKLGDAIENLVKGDAKDIITKEAIKVKKVLDKKNTYSEPLDDVLWRITPMDLAKLFQDKAPTLASYLAEYSFDAIMNVLQQKEPSLKLDTTFDEWIENNKK